MARFALAGLCSAVAATLLAAIALGQVGVKISGDVKTLAFPLFIYALGYMIGPQFESSLARATLKQVHLPMDLP